MSVCSFIDKVEQRKKGRKNKTVIMSKRNQRLTDFFGGGKETLNRSAFLDLNDVLKDFD